MDVKGEDLETPHLPFKQIADGDFGVIYGATCFASIHAPEAREGMTAFADKGRL